MHSPVAPADEELLTQVAAGDRMAFGTLYDRLGAPLARAPIYDAAAAGALDDAELTPEDIDANGPHWAKVYDDIFR